MGLISNFSPPPRGFLAPRAHHVAGVTARRCNGSLHARSREAHGFGDWGYETMWSLVAAGKRDYRTVRVCQCAEMRLPVNVVAGSGLQLEVIETTLDAYSSRDRQENQKLD